MAYRGKYPNRISSVSSISLFPGLYMITTNAGAKLTVNGKALDAVKDHLKADVSAFPAARLLTATAATRGDDGKALSVTLTYADGETVTNEAPAALPASGSALGKLAQKFRSFPAPSVRARIVAHVAKHPFSVCMASPEEIAFLKSNGFSL